MRKHMKVLIDKAHLANSLNHASAEAKLAQCENIIASGEAINTVKESTSASGEANKVPNNPISEFCEAKGASPSLNAFSALGKSKAQCSVKVQACKDKALPLSAKKASGEASVLSGATSGEVKA